MGMRSSPRLSNGSQGRSTTRPRRDRAALESRRRRAAALFRKGIPQADVARALEVSRQSVSRWYEQWRQGGDAALKQAARAGRPPLLSAAQLGAVEKVLLKGAVAYGYPNELWTLRRVAEVIEIKTGVRYHEGHVWRVLRGLGWSRQRPARRAVERDQEKIETWVKESWPDLKKSPPSARPGSSSKTSPASR